MIAEFLGVDKESLDDPLTVEMITEELFRDWLRMRRERVQVEWFWGTHAVAPPRNDARNED